MLQQHVLADCLQMLPFHAHLEAAFIPKQEQPLSFRSDTKKQVGVRVRHTPWPIRS